MSTLPNTMRTLPEDMVLVALGANLPSPAGRPAATFRAVLDELRTLAAGPVRASRFYTSEPVGCPPGTPAFLNAVALFAVAGSLKPHALLRLLQGLEARFGRCRSSRVNEARSLDLDLLAFGSRRLATPDLVLPHPRARERAFVLAPLAQVAPELRLPGWPASARTLLQRLPQEGLAPLPG